VCFVVRLVVTHRVPYTWRMSRLPHLFGMQVHDLVRHVETHGQAMTERDARRVLSCVIADGMPGLTPRRPVRKAVLDVIERTTVRSSLVVDEEITDPVDGFTKLLVRATDGALFEAVRIPLEKPNTYTVCLSSQVGCAMGCVFCATGRLGLTRNLTPAEMVGAFLAVRARTTTGRVRGVVFMGQGEPFHNYEAVIKAADILSDPSGARVDKAAITISTVGLVPMIRRYTTEGHPYKLIVSLTSADADRRRALLPVAGRHDFDDLVDAIHVHATKTGDRVTIAWVLMGGVNDGDDEIAALRTRFAGVPVRVNLIDVNDARDDGFRRATDDERNHFIDGLAASGLPFIRRYSGGQGRHAACGMLAATRFSDDESTNTSSSTFASSTTARGLPVLS
jgi:23S rRNA (adenine2503-C2)-methyltransferase